MPSHNLPRQATPFIGREEELALIAQLLSSPSCRLLTLVGPGGIGKTRLALEGARLFADAASGHLPTAFPDDGQQVDFSDGIYFVGIGPGGSIESVIAALARTVGCALFGEENVAEQLLSYLGNKRLLVVLDGFEYRLDTVPLLTDILNATSYVRFLITSRQRLLLQEEFTLEVAGLSVPVHGYTGFVGDFSAVNLFLQTARRYGADSSRLDVPQILRICRLVEGMPLAIELAAAWTRALSCQQIAAEIERSLDILATDSGARLEKHRSMRVVFEHSWQLLSDDERAVFQQLSAFRGGFTLAAARQVAGASLWILSALVDKSMLTVDTAGRFGIHDLLRQFADEQLAERPNAKEDTRNRHAIYYAEFLHEMGEKLKGPDQIEALDAIEADFENIREAWRWSVLRRDSHLIDQSLLALALYFQMRFRFQEGAEFFGLAADQWGSETHHLGYLLLLQGWFVDSTQDQILFRRGVDILRSTDFSGNLTVLFTMLYFSADHLGGYSEVRQMYRAKLASARRHDDLWVAAWALAGIGMVSYALNERDDAWDCMRKSLASFRSLGDSWGSVWALNSLASWYDARGDAELALATFRESLAICRAVGDLGGVIYAVGSLAAISGKWDDSEEFRQNIQRLVAKRAAISTQDIAQFCQIARWLEVQSGPELALQMIAHLRYHPRLRERWYVDMDEWIATFKVKLSEAQFTAAVEQGRISSSETMLQVLAQALADLESREASRSAPMPSGNLGSASDIVPGNLFGERELQVMTLAAQGLSSPEIADRLVLSVHTVRWYLKQIYAKLDVHNRTEAAVRVRELGLLSANNPPHKIHH